MNRLARLGLALPLLFAFAIGCTPSPESTCKRLQELGDKDPAGFKLSMSKCMDRMNEMKERDPDAYRCAAKTVAKLTTIDTALLAVSVCDHSGSTTKTAEKKGPTRGEKDD